MANNKVLNDANLVQSEPKFKEMGIQCNLMDCQCRWEDETVPAASDDEGPEDFEDAKATTSSNITIPSQTPVKPPTMSTALVPVNISPQKRARDKLRKDRADRRLAPASSVDLASIEKVHQTEVNIRKQLIYSGDVQTEKRKRDHSLRDKRKKSDKMGFKEKIQQKFLHPKEDSTRLLESSDEEM